MIPEGFIPLEKVATLNSSFSKEVPGLQLFWDATSMDKFKTCPKLYFFSIIQGYRPTTPSTDLVFGIAWHSALERYYRLRAQGFPHEKALHHTIAATWFRQLMPSHEEALSGGTKPEKSAKVLIRALVAYFDNYQDDNLFTVILPSGKPAVELSFSIPLPGTEFSWCGHIDRIVSQEDIVDLRTSENSAKSFPIFAQDYKTTTSSLDQRYWAQWDLNIQMSGYLVGMKTFLEGRGVVIEGIQLSVTGQSFGRYVVTKTLAQLESFLQDLFQDLSTAKSYAVAGRWPRNPTSCIHYGRLCAFHDICRLGNTRQQETFLKSNFSRSLWNPRNNR